MQSLVCWFYSTVTLSSYQLTCVIFICSADPTTTSQGVKNFARRLSHRKFALAKANFEKPVLKSPYNGILNPISPFDSGKFSCFTSSSTRHHGKPSLTAPHQSENVFAHGRQFFFFPILRRIFRLMKSTWWPKNWKSASQNTSYCKLSSCIVSDQSTVFLMCYTGN